MRDMKALVDVFGHGQEREKQCERGGVETPMRYKTDIQYQTEDIFCILIVSP